MKTIVFEKLKSYKYLSKKYGEEFERLISTYEGTIDINKAKIDYKIHELQIGDVPCRPIWHYDGTNDPSKPPIVRYALLLSGDADSRTEFFIDEPDLFDASEAEIHRYAKSKLNNNTYKIECDKWMEYTSQNLHCATLATRNGMRTLVRLKEE